MSEQPNVPANPLEDCPCQQDTATNDMHLEAPPTKIYFKALAGYFLILSLTSLLLAFFGDFIRESFVLTLLAGLLPVHILGPIIIVFILNRHSKEFTWSELLQYAPIRQTPPNPRRVFFSRVLAAYFGAGLLANLTSIVYMQLFGQPPENQWLIKQISSPTLPRSALLLVIVSTCVLAPIAEELIFRLTLTRALTRFLRRSIAIFVSAFIFAICHQMPTLIPSMIFLGWLFQKTADEFGICSSMILHAWYNTINVLLALLVMNGMAD